MSASSASKSRTTMIRVAVNDCVRRNLLNRGLRLTAGGLGQRIDGDPQTLELAGEIIGSDLP
jgi:hypothetical protein